MLLHHYLNFIWLTKIIKFSWLVLVCIFLSGCDPFSRPDTMLDEYLERLSRVLEYQQTSIDVVALDRLPSIKYRRYEIEPYTVNMLQFFSLYGCELQVLAGEKNSVLGKVMKPALRLDYELRFITAAEKCIEQNKNGAELQDTIQQVVMYKKAQLPKVLWNAIWTNDEITNYLSYSDGFYPLMNDLGHSTTSRKLSKLNKLIEQLLSQQYQTDTTILNQLLYQWQYDASAGQLLKSTKVITQYLKQANIIMAHRLKKPICYNNKSNPKAEIMEQFFFNIYIAKIQPYIAKTHQQTQIILPELNKMANFIAAPSVEFKQYKQQFSTAKLSTWGGFGKAIQQHTELWQSMLEQCGMRPSP